MSQKRVEAMKWWNSLFDITKQTFSVRYFDNRSWFNLTGREIEMLYNKIKG